MRAFSENIIRTPNQMKSCLGICNWYSIQIHNYASLAAPLMDSPGGKHKYNSDKRTGKVPAHQQTISWTDLMHEMFEKIKTSPCEACSLYIPSDQGEFAIHTDTSNHGIGAVLELRDDQGNWRSCAFLSQKIQGSSKYDADGNILGYMGHRAWSMRERETYALVSCLLKFKSRISEAQITVLTDHKSLESWYNEKLCTIAGPLGRRGRWREFLSRYNSVVVYEPGVENDAADGMSGWAYPAGLTDDTNFHGYDTDLAVVTQWEASSREEEQKLITAKQYHAKFWM